MEPTLPTATGERMGSAALGRRLAATFRPNPTIYWADLLISAGLGWGLFFLSAAATRGSTSHLLTTLGAAVALLRAAYFIHELSHLNPRALPGFAIGWHVVAGVPLLIPSLMIGAHKFHHRVGTYGTDQDPEYAPIAHWSALRVGLDLFSMLLVPPALVLRWALLGPVSWCIPPLRRLVVERMSTMAISPSYRRSLADGRRRTFLAQEALMAAFVWGALFAVPAPVILQWWLVAGMALLFNEVRTYTAHSYELRQRVASIDAQVADTVTVGGSLLAELLAPLGDRFHAAHHRFPSLPYHCLGAVHAQLMAELPADDPYRTTLRPGLAAALGSFARRVFSPGRATSG